MVVLLPMLGITWSWMLAKDGQLGKISDNIKGLNILFGRNGFVSQILSRLPEFIQPNFHPDQHDTKGLEKAEPILVHFFTDLPSQKILQYRINSPITLPAFTVPAYLLKPLNNP